MLLIRCYCSNWYTLDVGNPIIKICQIVFKSYKQVGNALYAVSSSSMTTLPIFCNCLGYFTTIWALIFWRCYFKLHILEFNFTPVSLLFSVIMVDEAHERSISTDILLGLLKKVWLKTFKLKIIVIFPFSEMSVCHILSCAVF